MVVAVTLNSALGRKRYMCFASGRGGSSITTRRFVRIGGKFSGYIASCICACPELKISLMRALCVLVRGFLVCLYYRVNVDLKAFNRGQKRLHIGGVVRPCLGVWSAVNVMVA